MSASNYLSRTDDIPGPVLPDDSSAVAKLEQRGIDWVCECIVRGWSSRKIAEHLGCEDIVLRRWIAKDSTRSTRAQAARIESSRHWDETAERSLIELASDGTPADIVRARELASHYRWRASKLAPQDYGDKQNTIQITGTNILVVGTGVPRPDALTSTEPTNTAIEHVHNDDVKSQPE